MHLIFETDLLTISIVGFLVGLLFCFFGKKLLGLVIVVFGFLIGYTLGAQYVFDILNKTISSSPWIPWVAGAVAAGLSVVAWKISMFFAGTVIGLFAARSLLPEIPDIGHLGIAVVSGVLAQVYRTPVIAFITALGGGYVAGSSALALLQRLGFQSAIGSYTGGTDSGLIIGIALTAIFTVAGYFYQTKALKQ